MCICACMCTCTYVCVGMEDDGKALSIHAVEENGLEPENGERFMGKKKKSNLRKFKTSIQVSY